LGITELDARDVDASLQIDEERLTVELGGLGNPISRRYELVRLYY
jgi:hypothetical protein